MITQYYYEARYNRKEGYYGVVYHWKGDEQVIDIKTDYVESGNEAIDIVVDMAEEKGLEPLQMA